MTNETSATELRDLTIRNGTERGVFIDDASPNIVNVEFDGLGRLGNALFSGGAARVEGGAPLFDGCVFTDNAAYVGGDLWIGKGRIPDPVIRNLGLP